MAEHEQGPSGEVADEPRPQDPAASLVATTLTDGPDDEALEATNDATARRLELYRYACFENAQEYIAIMRLFSGTERAEAHNEVGIYVYALPHHLRYPFDPASGRTLLKVGHSTSDVVQRFRSQTRTTALPEVPILLRICRTDLAQSAVVESQFHRLFEAADHSRTWRARPAGSGS